MWTNFWAHIIGDHQGTNPACTCQFLSFKVFSPCQFILSPYHKIERWSSCPKLRSLMSYILYTCYLMFVWETIDHSRSLIARSCLKTPPWQDKDPTIWHQTCLESRSSEHLVTILAYQVARPESCSVYQTRPCTASGWPQCVEPLVFCSHPTPWARTTLSLKIVCQSIWNLLQSEGMEPQTQLVKLLPVHRLERMA